MTTSPTPHPANLPTTGASPRPRTLTTSDALSEAIRRLCDNATRPVIILIDGRSGSGKTTIASSITHHLRAIGQGARTLHMDSIYPGWEGLAAGSYTLECVLSHLRTRGESPCPTWDWETSTLGRPLQLTTDTPLIVEGCGSLTTTSAALADMRIWRETPDDLRRHRALTRDGDMFRPYWDMWAQQEDEHLATHNPRALADIILVGDHATPPPHALEEDAGER